MKTLTITGFILAAIYCGYWASFMALKGRADSALWLVLTLTAVIFAFLVWSEDDE